MADISKIILPDNNMYNIKDGSAIANITRNGTTFVATKRDGTTFTFDQQNNYSLNNGYAFCTTASDVAAKTVTYTNYILNDPSIIAIKFTNANTIASPTLNINSQGAKAIWYQGAALSENAGKIWGAGDIVTFVYNTIDNSNGVYEIISIDKDHSIEISTLNPEYTQQKIWIEI